MDLTTYSWHFTDGKDIYKKVSDLIVENDTTIENCAKKVIKDYENSCN